MAVVDQHGRVHGLEALRVVDASIMPDCVRANTNVTTMMIGERGVRLYERGPVGLPFDYDLALSGGELVALPGPPGRAGLRHHDGALSAKVMTLMTMLYCMSIIPRTPLSSHGPRNIIPHRAQTPATPNG